MFKKIVITIIAISVICGILITYLSSKKNPNMILGVTFSSEYAGYLKQNPYDVFKIILDVWQFKYIRLMAQWNKIEPNSGIFDFRELDYFMDEAGKRNAKITLVIGQKTPRWPECHIPAWSKELKQNKYRESLLNYMEQVVLRYKDHPALEIWQVENEPFLSFGAECPKTEEDFLEEEIALVKSLDNSHPVIITDSGELSTWRRTARAGDLFGTTLYRVVWNESMGYWNYDWLPPVFYKIKLWLNHRALSEAFVAELQAEPWIPNHDLENTSLEEQNKSMDLKRLEKNIDYASRIGMPRAYLWGAEWWYWLKGKGELEIYNYIKQLKKE